jgi:hypothetical protein
MAKAADPPEKEIEIPETETEPEEMPEHGEGHTHTPGYPEHGHDGDGITYADDSVDAEAFDSDRHELDVTDQAERERQAELIGPKEVAEIATATLVERGGEVTQIGDPAPSAPGGVSFRVSHPRFATRMRLDIYPDE